MQLLSLEVSQLLPLLQYFFCLLRLDLDCLQPYRVAAGFRLTWRMPSTLFYNLGRCYAMNPCFNRGDSLLELQYSYCHFLRNGLLLRSHGSTPSGFQTCDNMMHIQTHRLMGRIYEVRRWDGLRCHNIHTEFQKVWFGHSKVDRGDTYTQTQHGNRISTL
jgi:hypothetical protein